MKIFKNVKDLSLSDHFLLSFCVPYELKKTHYKKVTYRNINKDVNKEAFSNEIRDSLNDLQLNGNFGDAITEYNNSMMSIMDRHAPKRTKKVKIAENASWFDNEYKELRKKRRKAEKTFLQHPSPENRETFKTIRKETTTLALRKKQDYYTDRINQAGNKQKELFKVVNKLRDLKQDSVLPSSTSDADLANEFVDYFKEKISKIRESFTCDPNTYPEFRRNAEIPTMNVFRPATEDELRSIVKSYGVSCSPEDPIQIDLMKDNIDVLLPCWLKLVNLSLSTGSIDSLKSAVLIPLLKELDSFVNIDLHKNYRPVSNLPFIEKLIERCVATRLNEHMQTNSLESSNEYGYKKGHSTELLLTKVTNDFLLSFDKKFVNVLLLLDLSAAFDTVDQDKLLKILHDDIGITGTAHQWFVSFLKGRTQKVMINGIFSKLVSLDFGVPQGSVLGPILFNIYIRSIYAYVEALHFKIEGYADDHQLYKQFVPIFQTTVLGSSVNECLSSISKWMNNYFLKLNKNKTKIMVLAPPSVMQSIFIHGTFIDNGCVRFVNCAKNLGVWIDSELTFKVQVQKVVSSYHHVSYY